MRIEVRNRAAEEATLHVLPTIWFRNEWSWNPDVGKPSLTSGPAGTTLLATHPELGEYTLEIGPGPDGRQPQLLFCENETNVARISGLPPATPYPKDGINDHVVGGAATVNPDNTGTKASVWYQADRAGGRDGRVEATAAEAQDREGGRQGHRPPRAVLRRDDEASRGGGR